MSTRSIHPTDGGSWGGYSVDKHEDCYNCYMVLHDATELGDPPLQARKVYTMKKWLFLGLYLLIGLGVAMGKPLTMEPKALQFSIRVLIWPATLAQEASRNLMR